MKVMHIISGGDTGGAKPSVINLLAELQKLMPIKLVCFMEGDFSEAAREKNIAISVLEQSSRWDLSVLSAIKETIVSEHFDLINCHGARANFIGALLKKHLTIPIITTMHSDYRHDFDNRFYKKILFTWLNKNSFKKMDGFITNSENFKNELISRKMMGAKIFVAYNGLSVEPSTHHLSKEDFLRQYHIEADASTRLVGCASRLHPIKGVEVLLRGAKELKQYDKNVKFLIAGNGEDRYVKQYKAYIKDNQLEDTVYLLGFVRAMDEFYHAIDLNVLTSHSEGISYALLEGGKSEIPTIASAVGGTPELIVHEKTGLLFQDDDSSEFAKCLLRLLDDWSLAKELGQNLRSHIHAQFSDRAMASRYEEIYKQILMNFTPPSISNTL